MLEFITRMGYHFRLKIGEIPPKIAILSCRVSVLSYTASIYSFTPIDSCTGARLYHHNLYIYMSFLICLKRYGWHTCKVWNDGASSTMCPTHNEPAPYPSPLRALASWHNTLPRLHTHTHTYRSGAWEVMGSGWGKRRQGLKRSWIL